MTQTEAAELAMIEQNVTVDTENNCVRIRYPTKGDLSQFKDNQKQAKACAESLERKLTKNNTRELYNSEFEGYVDRGVFKGILRVINNF